MIANQVLAVAHDETVANYSEILDTMNTDTDGRVQAPIFLVGAERSGTTLLRLMLNAHPMITFNEEFEYSVSKMGNGGELPDLKSYHQFLSTNRIFAASKFQVDPKLNYRELVRGFLRQKRERDGKRFVGAVVHHHFDRLLHLWPDARFIHIVRDPRDVAKSAIGMGWAGNTWVGAGRWIEAENIWKRLSSSLAPGRFTDLRYEDLIQDSEVELSRLCSFVGVEFDKRMFDYADDSTYELPDPSLVYQWRKNMSHQDIQLVEARVGDLLEAAGYVRSGQAPISVDPARAADLERQSRDWCRRFRARRYGWPLLVGSKIAKSLPFQTIRDHFQEKINRIDITSLK